jgi:hypothetical protein
MEWTKRSNTKQDREAETWPTPLPDTSRLSRRSPHIHVELITTLATARELHEVCWKMYTKRQSDPVDCPQIVSCLFVAHLLCCARKADSLALSCSSSVFSSVARS